MAPTSHGRAGVQAHHGSSGEGSINNNHQPPPSTLAAQLVENISASSKSSRPDETAELKKFFGIIEKVKNQPDTLKSPQERVEHNHMLIYVYARVVLEGLKLEDPFASRAQLQADALRAINFLQVTIKETPEVLLASSPNGTFVFRGKEALWVWMLPRVLRMLGHSQCLILKDSIEEFLCTLYTLVCDTGCLWSLAPQIVAYLKEVFSGNIGCSSPKR
jgi:serine/threonine-protein kinase ATR